ncbi:unnamed protein product, partial [Cuscuta epithymum]
MVSDDQAATSSPGNDTISSVLPSSQVSLSNAHHFVSLKLTSRNYLFWKTQLVPLLRGNQLLGYVDGTMPCPPKSDPTYSTWVTQDQSILSMLISSLSEEIMPLAIGHSTARDVWVAIERALASQTRARSLSLLTQFQSLRQGDMSHTEYLGKAKVLVENLAQSGRPVSLDEQNLYVFRGLRSDYRSMVSTLATQPEPATLDEIAHFITTHQFIYEDEPSIPVSDLVPSPPTAHLSHTSHQMHGSSSQSSALTSSGRQGGYRGRGSGSHRGRSPARGRGVPHSNPHSTCLVCQICG